MGRPWFASGSLHIAFPWQVPASRPMARAMVASPYMRQLRFGLP